MPGEDVVLSFLLRHTEGVLVFQMESFFSFSLQQQVEVLLAGEVQRPLDALLFHLLCAKYLLQ